MKLLSSLTRILLSQRAHSTFDVINLMQHLENGMLLNCGGKLVNAGKAFAGKKIIAYYFSASWCGPCKQLLPKLKDVYQTLKECLENGELLTLDGKLVNVEKALVGKKIIAYYFSASWCAPCKQLLPKLKNLYQKAVKYESGLEIIYISSDTDPNEMVKYFKERHGGWYAVPFEDNGGEIMRQIYQVTHVPKIVVVREDGVIITKNGVQDINNLGLDVLVAWNVAPI